MVIDGSFLSTSSKYSTRRLIISIVTALRFFGRFLRFFGGMGMCVEGKSRVIPSEIQVRPPPPFRAGLTSVNKRISGWGCEARIGGLAIADWKKEARNYFGQNEVS
jgi:hypothetical protein